MWKRGAKYELNRELSCLFVRKLWVPFIIKQKYVSFGLCSTFSNEKIPLLRGSLWDIWNSYILSLLQSKFCHFCNLSTYCKITETPIHCWTVLRTDLICHCPPQNVVYKESHLMCIYCCVCVMPAVSKA